jgi:hypothetical protein
VAYAQTSLRVKGLVLAVDELSAEDADTLKEWLEPVMEAVDPKLLVSDDADAFKTVAKDLGLEHQVCKGHVKRNIEKFSDDLEYKVDSDEDGSLTATGATPDQALQDLRRLGSLIYSRQPEEESALEEMHHLGSKVGRGQ